MRMTEILHYLNNQVTSDWMAFNFTHYTPTDNDRKYKDSLKKEQKRDKKDFKKMDLF